MSERKGSAAEGLALCWLIIAFVYCAMTGQIDLFLIGSGAGVLAAFVVRFVRRRKERGK